MHRRAFLERSTRAALTLGILRHITACRSEARPSAADAGFVDLRDQYFLKFLQQNPVISTYFGGDGYTPALAGLNRGLRDYHPAALEAEGRAYQGLFARLQQIPSDSPGAIARIDHGVVSAQLRFLLREFNDRHYYQRSLDSYVAEPFRGVDWQIQQMGGGTLKDAEGQRGSETEWNDVVLRINSIPEYLDAAKANLRAGKASGNMPDRRMVQRDGIQGSKANADYFRTTLHESAKDYLGSRPFASKTATRLRDAGTAAAAAWDGFTEFLAATFDLTESADRFAMGDDEYQWRVQNCLLLPQSTEELFEYGAQQVALYEEQVYTIAADLSKQAGLRLSFGTKAERQASVAAVMEYLSHDSPRDDAELLRWYQEAGERAVAYGRAQQLFDIPLDYRLDIYPTPPVLRNSIDAAYYPAPPFKRVGVGRFYLTPTGNDPAALRLNNRASVADTAVHEGFPGHDWHFKYMAAHAAQISNVRWLTPGGVEDSASMWEDSMAVEGWGLYAEELMATPAPDHAAGFYSTGELLYELQGQLLRAVRVRVDVGIHTGRMTYDEALDYFTEHVRFYPQARSHAGRDPTARAIAEEAGRAIYRYSKWPTQAITYNLGKNAIVQLREAYRQKMGPRYSAKEFHERFMGMGTIPAGYFREAFLNADGLKVSGEQ